MSNLPLYIFLEAFGFWRIEQVGEDKLQGVVKWHRKDKTLLGFCRCLSEYLRPKPYHKNAKSGGFFSRFQDKSYRSFYEPYSLLTLTRHMSAWLIEDNKNLIPEGSQNYIFIGIVRKISKQDPTNSQWQLLLSRHEKWPMYLLPSFNQKDKSDQHGSPCLVHRCYNRIYDQDPPQFNCSNGTVNSNGICTVTINADNICDCVLNLPINRNTYPSPSGAGPTKHSINIKLCIIDENTCPDIVTFFKDNHIVESRYAWFTREQLERYEHITRVLQRENKFKERVELFVNKLERLRQEKSRNEWENTLTHIFAEEIFGPVDDENSKGKFPDNLDVTNAIFDFLVTNENSQVKESAIGAADK